MSLLKKYPDFEKQFKVRMKDMRKTLNSVLDELEQKEQTE